MRHMFTNFFSFFALLFSAGEKYARAIDITGDIVIETAESYKDELHMERKANAARALASLKEVKALAAK